jgi:hypothetical protein
MDVASSSRAAGTQLYQVAMIDQPPATGLTAAPAGAQAGVFFTQGIDVGSSGLGYATVPADVDQRTVIQVWKVDANSGAMTDPRTVAAPQGYDLEECPGIDLQADGQILFACSGLLDLVEVGVIGFVTVPESGDAVLTPKIVVGDSDGQVQVQFTAIATDPRNGTTWASGSFTAFDGTDFGWFLVDPQQQTIGPAIHSDTPVGGADFDRSGQLWALADNGTCSELVVVDPTTGAVGDDHGCLEPTPGQPDEDIQALTIWGGGLGEPGPGAAPALPPTGAEVGLPLGLGTALLLLVGAAFVAWSWRRSTGPTERAPDPA